MSAYLMGRAFYTDLPAHLRFLLVALCDHAHDDGTSIKVGQTRLAHKTGASERTVRANLGELRRLGYIERLSSRSRAGVDQYRIILGMLPTHAEIDERPADLAGASDQGDRKPTAGPDRKPTSAEPSVEPSKDLAPSRRDRKRDEFFEAVMEVSGIDLAEIPDEARGSYNAAVAGLRKLGATPEEVRRRAPRAWFTVTPAALLRHWAELRGPGRAGILDHTPTQPCGECGGWTAHRQWCPTLAYSAFPPDIVEDERLAGGDMLPVPPAEEQAVP